MAPPKAYLPADNFPNLTGAAVAGVPTVLLQEAGDHLLWYETWRNDYEIATVSNTTPIVVTTAVSFAGKIVTGQSVFVQGVTGSSTANGFWTTVTVTGTTTFELDGSVAGGAGTGGRAYEMSLGLFSKLLDACNWLRRVAGFTYTTGVVSMQGRKVWNRPRVALTDASQTIDVSMGDRFILPNAPAAIRSIVIDDVTVAPQENECIELLVPGPIATGLQFHVFRADTTPIADLYGNGAGDAGIWSQFEYSGGVWRLGANMGGGAAGGVLPLVGA